MRRDAHIFVDDGHYAEHSRCRLRDMDVRRLQVGDVDEAPQNVFRRGRAELSLLLGDISTAGDVARLLSLLATPPLDVAEVHACVEEASRLSGTKENIEVLFKSICGWALEALDESGSCAFPKQVEVWPPGGGARRAVYSSAQCRGLLSNAVLLNVNDTCAHFKPAPHAGGVDLGGIFSRSSGLAAQKLACFLQYFETSRLEDSDREVVFERRVSSDDVLALSEFKRWAAECGAARNFEVGAFRLHNSSMEAVSGADAFVNFANANFGYGHITGAGFTQEEIIQVCCPEFNVGMLHQGRMMDHEVVNVSGVRRFSSYKGYGPKFEFQGAWSGSPVSQTILTMDATTRRHFTEDVVLRDIRKAYLCFQGCRKVSTGRWGCGNASTQICTAAGGRDARRLRAGLLHVWHAR